MTFHLYACSRFYSENFLNSCNDFNIKFIMMWTLEEEEETIKIFTLISGRISWKYYRNLHSKHQLDKWMHKSGGAKLNLKEEESFVSRLLNIWWLAMKYIWWMNFLHFSYSNVMFMSLFGRGSASMVSGRCNYNCNALYSFPHCIVKSNYLNWNHFFSLLFAENFNLPKALDC